MFQWDLDPVLVALWNMLKGGLTLIRDIMTRFLRITEVMLFA